MYYSKNVLNLWYALDSRQYDVTFDSLNLISWNAYESLDVGFPDGSISVGSVINNDLLFRCGGFTATKKVPRPTGISANLSIKINSSGKISIIFDNCSDPKISNAKFLGIAGNNFILMELFGGLVVYDIDEQCIAEEDTFSYIEPEYILVTDLKKSDQDYVSNRGWSTEWVLHYKEPDMVSPDVVGTVVLWEDSGKFEFLIAQRYVSMLPPDLKMMTGKSLVPDTPDYTYYTSETLESLDCIKGLKHGE